MNNHNQLNHTPRASQGIDRDNASLRLRIRTVTALADDPLLQGLQQLAVRRRQLVSELLVYLGEVDARKLYVRFATSSCFAFCVQKLGLSEPSAYRYLAAARLARRYPLALERLEQGRVHLSALAMLSKHVNDENGAELLQLADSKSKRQLERALAERFPKADVPSSIRKLPEPVLNKPVADEPAMSAASAPAAAKPSGAKVRVKSEPSAAGRPRIEPLRARRYRIQFSASQSFVDKLEKAQALLGHQVPGGDLETVLEKALETLVAQKMKQKFAQTDKRRKPRPRSSATKPVSNKPANSARSRHIPAAVKRAVLERDGMRCSYVDELGQRCPETSGLEFHHQQPFAHGGPPTADNVALSCRPHNFYQAELDFGRPLLRRRIAERRAGAGPQRPREPLSPVKARPSPPTASFSGPVTE